MKPTNANGQRVNRNGTSPATDAATATRLYGQVAPKPKRSPHADAARRMTPPLSDPERLRTAPTPLRKSMRDSIKNVSNALQEKSTTKDGMPGRYDAHIATLGYLASSAYAAQANVSREERIAGAEIEAQEKNRAERRAERKVARRKLKKERREYRNQHRNAKSLVAKHQGRMGLFLPEFSANEVAEAVRQKAAETEGNPVAAGRFGKAMLKWGVPLLFGLPLCITLGTNTHLIGPSTLQYPAEQWHLLLISYGVAFATKVTSGFLSSLAGNENRSEATSSERTGVHRFAAVGFYLSVAAGVASEGYGLYRIALVKDGPNSLPPPVMAFALFLLLGIFLDAGYVSFRIYYAAYERRFGKRIAEIKGTEDYRGLAEQVKRMELAAEALADVESRRTALDELDATEAAAPAPSQNAIDRMRAASAEARAEKVRYELFLEFLLSALEPMRWFYRANIRTGKRIG